MRGGFGLYYQYYYRHGSESRVGLNAPYLVDAQLSRTSTEAPALFLQNGFPPDTLTPVDIKNLDQVSQLFIRAIDSNLRVTEIYQGSYGFQYSFTPNLLVEADYVVNAGHHIWNLSNVNQSRLNPPGQPPVIPFPDFRQNRSLPPSQTGPTYIEWLDSADNSIYDGLQVKLEKRFSKGLNFLAAYTWSKSLAT